LKDWSLSISGYRLLPEACLNVFGGDIEPRACVEANERGRSELDAFYQWMCLHPVFAFAPIQKIQRDRNKSLFFNRQ